MPAQPQRNSHAQHVGVTIAVTIVVDGRPAGLPTAGNSITIRRKSRNYQKLKSMILKSSPSELVLNSRKHCLKMPR